MTDLAPITLAEAADLFPKRRGKKVHVKTIKRRIIKGCRGVRLEGFKDGGIWYTTPQAIREFREACTRQAIPAIGARRAKRERQLANLEAKELLKRRYGFNVSGGTTTQER
jgi:hypothetical protein